MKPNKNDNKTEQQTRNSEASNRTQTILNLPLVQQAYKLSNE